MRKIKMQIESVSSLDIHALALVILSIHPDSSYISSLKLPLKIGSGDAILLCTQLGRQNIRPTTHTLLSNIIDEMGGEVESVCISRVEGSLFYADITISTDSKSYLIDARPSDALSLAATTKCPIYCTEEVLTTAGMPDFRAIKENMECDEVLSDLIDKDLRRDYENDLANNSIDETIQPKIDLIEKLESLEDEDKKKNSSDTDHGKDKPDDSNDDNPNGDNS